MTIGAAHAVAPQPPPAPPERTKVRLLELVKRHGPQTAQDLAARLEVSVPAARRHLGDLQEQGLLLSRTERPGGRGRPQHVFSLTERGEAAFPRTYSGLCVDVLRHVEGLFGDGAVLKVLDARNVEIAARLQNDLPNHLPLEDRIRRLAVLLTDMGFDPVLEKDGADWCLTQRNCPNLTVARQYSQLCDSELRLYAELLGTRVVRESRIACGQAACRYRIVG
ncbi:helix-turn-helix transcriptional regulator [Deinococcus humi]|uniref:Putative ArsR family transcriptional regulator n=1 Tax=Deinococcus humi TaxID=662880 RepID=A0A7W8JR36_9DEIO|nr:metalloregulator ArsR/SmtB family transcription factor [Deinococcus humi]MBB5361390.1 putative ArsR family transcriptional regulator [Deinococcus humi]GGO19827.1 transcriptional regulator [Deinococcus humi]